MRFVCSSLLPMARAVRKLVHISDLHFGRADPAVVAALGNTINALAPDVIAVSGDLTQRAKRHEFIAARAFLDRLGSPKVVVPGNHDIPFYDLRARFLSPLKRFQQYVGDPAAAVFADEEIVVVGVNTARSLVFKGGRINMEQVQRARALFCAEARRVRILVTHHPFHLASARRRELVGRAATALSQFQDCIPDVLLAGHIHVHETGTTAKRYDLTGRVAVVVQAGTATSTRRRGELNSFNLLNVEQDLVTVGRYDWSSQEGEFSIAAVHRYVRRGLAWVIEANPIGASDLRG